MLLSVILCFRDFAVMKWLNLLSVVKEIFFSFHE
jgi:hypothetical protein